MALSLPFPADLPQPLNVEQKEAVFLSCQHFLTDRRLDEAASALGATLDEHSDICLSRPPKLDDHREIIEAIIGFFRQVRAQSENCEIHAMLKAYYNEKKLLLKGNTPAFAKLRDFFQDRFGAYGFTKTGKKLKLNKPPFPTRKAAQESDSYKATEFKLNCLYDGVFDLLETYFSEVAKISKEQKDFDEVKKICEKLRTGIEKMQHQIPKIPELKRDGLKKAIAEKQAKLDDMAPRQLKELKLQVQNSEARQNCRELEDILEKMDGKKIFKGHGFVSLAKKLVQAQNCGARGARSGHRFEDRVLEFIRGGGLTSTFRETFGYPAEKCGQLSQQVLCSGTYRGERGPMEVDFLIYDHFEPQGPETEDVPSLQVVAMFEVKSHAHDLAKACKQSRRQLEIIEKAFKDAKTNDGPEFEIRCSSVDGMNSGTQKLRAGNFKLIAEEQPVAEQHVAEQPVAKRYFYVTREPHPHKRGDATFIPMSGQIDARAKKLSWQWEMESWKGYPSKGRILQCLLQLRNEARGKRKSGSSNSSTYEEWQNLVHHGLSHNVIMLPQKKRSAASKSP